MRKSKNRRRGNNHGQGRRKATRSHSRSHSKKRKTNRRKPSRSNSRRSHRNKRASQIVDKRLLKPHYAFTSRVKREWLYSPRNKIPFENLKEIIKFKKGVRFTNDAARKRVWKDYKTHLRNFYRKYKSLSKEQSYIIIFLVKYRTPLAKSLRQRGYSFPRLLYIRSEKELISALKEFIKEFRERAPDYIDRNSSRDFILLNGIRMELVL